MPVTKFVVDRTYTARSIGDSNCIWSVRIISRTAKRVEFKIGDEPGSHKKGIHVYEGVEKVFFLGKYSMAPMISADKEAV